MSIVISVSTMHAKKIYLWLNKIKKISKSYIFSFRIRTSELFVPCELVSSGVVI